MLGLIDLELGQINNVTQYFFFSYYDVALNLTVPDQDQELKGAGLT